MSKIITIAIDAMGGDNSPDKTIQGVNYFLKKNNLNRDYRLDLFGDKKKIEQKLKQYNISSNLIKVIHTDSVISDEETPINDEKKDEPISNDSVVVEGV